MEASVMTRFSSYDEELKMNTIEDNGVYASGDKIKNYIPSMEDRDIENFIIISSKLLYIGKNELETEVAEKLKLGGSGDVSDVGAVVEEVQQIVDNVVEVSEGNKDKVPTGDSDKLDDLNKLKEEGREQYTDDSEGLIGVRLFTRNGLNMNNGNWNILIEYNSSNKETARYGTGYYWLKKGTTYTINGENIEFKNDYVVDYSKGEYYVLSGRAVNWNVKSTLGVSDNIALNLDPISLAKGKWIEGDESDEISVNKYQNFYVESSTGLNVDTGIQKVGDVVYDDINKALKFNEDETTNPTGEGGYLRLKKDGTNLEGGFTFEFYGRFSRGLYVPDTINSGGQRLGFFCYSINLGSVTIPPGTGLRFFLDQNGNFMDTNFAGEVNDVYGYITTEGGSHVRIDNFKNFSDYGFDVGKEFYFTLACVTSDDSDEIVSGGCIRLDYYIDGERLGYCYMLKSRFTEKAQIWSTSNFKFYIGACTTWNPQWNCFMKGDCYSCRLYSCGLNSEQVKLNYDMTLKYRDSFKNE